MELLDNPAWHALTTQQRHLGILSAVAARYHPDVAPFAGVGEPSPPAFQELVSLSAPRQPVLLQTPGPLPPMDGIRADCLFPVLQMVDAGVPGASDDSEVLRLTRADVADMLALAQATQPGPFGPRTIETGNYLGIRAGGRLVAMAGERMRLDGHVEISAVCVDASQRGKRLGARLMNVLRREIRRRGDTPFLHVRDDNHAAIALYERLGFETRRNFLLHRVGRTEPM